MKRLNAISIIDLVSLLLYFVLCFLDGSKTIPFGSYAKVIYILCLFFINFTFSYKEHKINFGKRENTKRILFYLTIILLVYFLSGLLFGYSYNVYSYDVRLIIYNIMVIMLPLLLEEYIRYYVLMHRSGKKIYAILITVLLILININYTSIFNLKNNRDIYIYLFYMIFPLISQNIILTQVTLKFGLKSSLVYKLIYTLFILYIPLLLSLGYFITSCVLIGIPIITYMLVNKDTSDKHYVVNRESKAGVIAFYIFIIILLCFSFGFFTYRPVGVASNSMKPVFKRGDMVIYKKANTKSSIKKDDIIAFEKNNEIIIHRVYQIVKNNDKIYYITKGDNNGSVDTGKISKKDVLGKKVLSIPYIGYPSVLINDMFNK